MMARKPGRFLRALGTRRYRKLFLVAAEGRKTGPQYFGMLGSQRAVVCVKCLKGYGGSSPPQVLDRMRKALKKKSLRKSDEAWLVVDKDQWTDSQLSQLHDWSQSKPNYGFALSNPSFEYWLLLHFEDGKGISTSQQCAGRLKKHLPGYGKGIAAQKTNDGMVRDAIRRAKARDNPPCVDWPRDVGGTTVYRLVESILNA